MLSQVDKLSPAWRPWLAQLLDGAGAMARNGKRRGARIVATSSSAEGVGVAADLLDALQPVPIFLPALRHRRCDIPALVEHFLARSAEEESMRPSGISDEALVFLWVHARYGEIGSMVASGALGLLMAFLAYGRRVLRPIR